MGMSLTIATALQSVAIAWVNTKAAPFGALVARKEYEQLDRVFFRALRHSIFVYCAGALLVWLGTDYLNAQHVRLAQRVLSPPVLGLLFLATLLNVIVFAQSIYLRAHKQEKYMGGSIVSAILVGLSTYFLGKTYGAAGMVTGYFAIGLLGGIWYSTYLFVKYRREWHAN
jgi:O-antigen/teichoic acid export membrane protein